MTTKKSSTKQNATKSTNIINELRADALAHEDAGRWLDAAEAWTKLAQKADSKKLRSEASGRAAAAKVRAAAAVQPLESRMPSTVDVAAAPATSGDATPSAPDARDGAPADGDAPSPTPVAPGAPTGEPVANDAPTGEAGAPTNDGSLSNDAAPTPDSTPRASELPAVGTVIKKLDRAGQVRCECTIVEAGVQYKDTTYKSLSAAALAASKDLGLTVKTLDGWAWWGLKTRAAEPSARGPGDQLTRAFARYHERAATLLKSATGDNANALRKALRAQADALRELAAE